MDSSVFENTCEQNHKEPPKLASAYWQPVRDSSLVAKIAPGMSGEEGGVEEERRACWFHWDPLSPLPVLRPCGAPRKASFRRAPELFLPCHSVCRGREEAWHGWS